VVYKLNSPFWLIHLTVFVAGPVTELERYALKETIVTPAPRFENLIKIESPRNVIFSPVNAEDVRIRKVFTNHRCDIFKVFPHKFPEGETETSDYADYWSLINPGPGCLVMAEIDRLGPEIKMLFTPGRMVNTGYAAFIFDGKSWEHWRSPRDVEVYWDLTDGLQVAIKGLRCTELVRVNSRGHRHELITFEHALDYCVGKRSLADILALVEAEERLRLYKEREVIYKNLLVLVRKFKGAVRSKTAAEIEDLLMELVGEKLPF